MSRRRLSGIALLVLLAFLLLGLGWVGLPSLGGIAMTQSDSLDTRVAQAFERARAGDFEQVSQLANAGAGVIPHLQAYVGDGDEMLRLQAVSLLATFDDARALPLLKQALADPLQDIRARAALALYEHFDPPQLAKDESFGKALRGSLDQGNDAAAAILLLAWFPNEESRSSILALRERAGEGLSELHSWTPAVRTSLVGNVALSRIGDRDARLSLLERIGAGDLKELSFLLSVLREIDSPEVTHALAKATLADEREVQDGVPSGAEPELRLCDLAVVAFSKDLGLEMKFPVDEPRRFTAAEIEAVRQALRESLPRG